MRINVAGLVAKLHLITCRKARVDRDMRYPTYHRPRLCQFHAFTRTRRNALIIHVLRHLHPFSLKLAEGKTWWKFRNGDEARRIL